MPGRIITVSLLYWVLAFGAGWVLGPIRELWAIPRFGRTAAILLEAPFMLLVIFAAARWTLRWLSVYRRAAPWMGLGGLGPLGAAEIARVRCVRGLSVADYLGTFTPVPAAVSLLMFRLFAVMPALAARAR
jgi:hypothetical protein